MSESLQDHHERIRKLESVVEALEHNINTLLNRLFQLEEKERQRNWDADQVELSLDEG